MIKTLITSLTFTFALMATHLFALELKSDAPQQYTVKKGDTLWDISARFIGEPWKWPQIWHKNPQIKNPDLIYPGDLIGLIKQGNKTKLGIISRAQQTTENPRPIQAVPDKALSRKVASYHFFSPEEIDSAAYILAATDDRLLISTGDVIYAKGELDAGQPIYYIYRIGKQYVDKESDEILGQQALKIGSAKLLKQDNDVVSLEVVSADQEIRKGDRILSLSPHIEENIVPNVAPDDLTGYIIGSPKKIKRIGQYDLLALNLGTEHGIQAGTLLMVSKKGASVKDKDGESVTLPDKQAGLVMVYKVAEKMSYALVLKAQLAIKEGDKVIQAK